MVYNVVTLAERPELRRPISDIHNQVWPRFMRENDVANRAWDYLFSAFPQFQVAVCDDSGAVLAAGQALPFSWDGSLDTLPEGWEPATEQAMRDYDERRVPGALTAYAIVVSPDHQGKGLSSLVLDAMKSAAGEQVCIHWLRACAPLSKRNQ